MTSEQRDLIERCARVAEGQAEFVAGKNHEQLCHSIAKLIRALSDAPDGVTDVPEGALKVRTTIERCARVAESVGRTRDALQQAEPYKTQPQYKLTGESVSSHIAAAIRAIARPMPQQAGGWLPIESAPKDGTWVYGYQTPEDGGKYPGNVVMRCRFADWYTDGGHGYCHCEPTHWQPLPSPPESAKEGEK